MLESCDPKTVLARPTFSFGHVLFSPCMVEQGSVHRRHNTGIYPSILNDEHAYPPLLRQLKALDRVTLQTKLPPCANEVPFLTNHAAKPASDGPS